MPITQDRMLSILTEGLRIRRESEALREEITSALRNARTGSDPTMALALIEGALALHPMPAADNLLVEARHYQVSRKRNEKNKEHMRNRRATGSGGNSPAPTLAHSTAPSSLIRPLEDQPISDELLAEFEAWNKGEE